MLYNDPMSFREDMLKGYVAAYPDYVTEVPGGVARATKMPADKVAVVNGGGSGLLRHCWRRIHGRYRGG